MNLLLSDLIDSFESDSKNQKEKYDQFLSYVYITFDKKIRHSSSKKVKDKYKEIQKSILQYIIANKKEIIKNIK
jgi:hypothetical protein